MRLTTPTDLSSLAKLILSKECQNIAFLTGAGVSVASGIPDFRSPGGMYDTLRPDLLTASPQQKALMQMDPTYVVSWDIFQSNPFPYLEVRRPFILGTRNHQWKATVAHRFAELIETKLNKLTRVYTQNIDGLDQQCTSIPSSKVIPVHGTISQVQCEGCGSTDMELDEFCDKLETNIKDIYERSTMKEAPETSTPILCKSCNKPLVKPSTVLFGRSLPEEFFTCSEEDLEQLDLLIIAGTSLVVSPANSLVHRVSDSTVRVVVNTEPVGEELGIQYSSETDQNHCGRDFFARGTCEQVFVDLIQELGWMEDLQAKHDVLPPSSQKLLDTYR